MARITPILLIIFSLNLFTACSPDTESGSKTVTPDTNLNETSPDENENFPEDNPPETDDNCGSLKPLLKLLPQAKEMDGLPETFRGCENSSEQTVSVIYNNEGDDYSEYQFKIYVLNPESVYAKANLTLENATLEQQAFINQAFKTTGDMHKTRLELCHHYHQNPMIPDGRNPLITQDVCVMDNMDANKEIWNAYTIKNDLEFHLELQGRKAAIISTTDIAARQLVPLFNQFNLQLNP